jgi:ATP-binding cassette subfamily C (CFTR/MRP) protein 4
VTVRAYNAQQRFWKEFAEVQNANARAFFTFLGCARWVGFRLDVGSGLLLILTAFVSVIMRSSQKVRLIVKLNSNKLIIYLYGIFRLV